MVMGFDCQELRDLARGLKGVHPSQLTLFAVRTRCTSGIAKRLG